jgi:hypothetical protein
VHEPIGRGVYFNTGGGGGWNAGDKTRISECRQLRHCVIKVHVHLHQCLWREISAQKALFVFHIYDLHIVVLVYNE